MLHRLAAHGLLRRYTLSRRADGRRRRHLARGCAHRRYCRDWCGHRTHAAGLAAAARHLPTDTLLGILSHGALAIGLIVISTMDKVRVDLFGYLFGDILAVSANDLYWIYGGAAVLILGLAAIWRPLIALTVHENLAMAERHPRRSHPPDLHGAHCPWPWPRP